jgi:hypothetical protein
LAALERAAAGIGAWIQAQLTDPVTVAKEISVALFAGAAGLERDAAGNALALGGVHAGLKRAAAGLATVETWNTGLADTCARANGESGVALLIVAAGLERQTAVFALLVGVADLDWTAAVDATLDVGQADLADIVGAADVVVGAPPARAARLPQLAACRSRPAATGGVFLRCRLNRLRSTR